MLDTPRSMRIGLFALVFTVFFPAERSAMPARLNSVSHTNDPWLFPSEALDKMVMPVIIDGRRNVEAARRNARRLRLFMYKRRLLGDHTHRIRFATQKQHEFPPPTDTNPTHRGKADHGGGAGDAQGGPVQGHGHHEYPGDDLSPGGGGVQGDMPPSDPPLQEQPSTTDGMKEIDDFGDPVAPSYPDDLWEH